MARGGPRPNSGGARPGAGRKLDPAIARFRDRIRSYANAKAGWALAMRHSKEDPAFYLGLLKFAFPPPAQEIDLGIGAADPLEGVKFSVTVSTAGGKDGAP